MFGADVLQRCRAAGASAGGGIQRKGAKARRRKDFYGFPAPWRLCAFALNLGAGEWRSGDSDLSRRNQMKADEGGRAPPLGRESAAECGRPRPQQCPNVGALLQFENNHFYHVAAPEDGRTPAADTPLRAGGCADGVA